MRRWEGRNGLNHRKQNMAKTVGLLVTKQKGENEEDEKGREEAVKKRKLLVRKRGSLRMLLK